MLYLSQTHNDPHGSILCLLPFLRQILCVDDHVFLRQHDDATTRVLDGLVAHVGAGEIVVRLSRTACDALSSDFWCVCTHLHGCVYTVYMCVCVCACMCVVYVYVFVCVYVHVFVYGTYVYVCVDGYVHVPNSVTMNNWKEYRL